MSEMGKIIMSPPPPPYAPCTRDEVATTMDAGPGTESSLDANGWDPRKSSAAARCLGVVAIDGALSASAGYRPEDFKSGTLQRPAETRCLKRPHQM